MIAILSDTEEYGSATSTDGASYDTVTPTYHIEAQSLYEDAFEFWVSIFKEFSLLFQATWVFIFKWFELSLSNSNHNLYKRKVLWVLFTLYSKIMIEIEIALLMRLWTNNKIYIELFNLFLLTRIFYSLHELFCTYNLT